MKVIDIGYKKSLSGLKEKLEIQFDNGFHISSTFINKNSIGLTLYDSNTNSVVQTFVQSLNQFDEVIESKG